MIKKVIFGLVVLAGLGIYSACTSSDEPAAAGETVTVTFTTSFGDVAGSRADDGSTIDVLYYAVYSHKATAVAGGEAKTVTLTPTNVAGSTSTKNENGDFTLSVDLVKNQEYNVIFWAQNSNCEAYMLGNKLTTVTVDYTKQLTDAYYGQSGVVDTKSVTSTTVKLSRPFAQLNVNVSDAHAAQNLNFKITAASATVSEYADVLNLLSGEKTAASGSYTATATWENGMNAVEGSNNLISALIMPTGNVVTLDVKVNGGVPAEGGIALSIPNCPLNANYRTIVDGNWLTKSNSFTVELDGFDGTEVVDPNNPPTDTEN